MNKNKGTGDLAGRGPLPSVAAYGASFPGRDHTRRARNNQDGFAVGRSGEVVCAAVCDGCGEGAESEVGARLAARWLVGHLPGLLADLEGLADDERAGALARRANLGLAAFLSRLVADLGTSDAREQRIADLGLFTWLAAVVSPERYVVVGLGDGVVAVNHRVTVLEAGPGNAPDYVGYRLVARERLSGTPELEARVLAWGRLEDFESIVLATDGAGVLCRLAGEVLPDGRTVSGLLEVALDGPVAENPSLLEKRLRVLAERGHLLHDDTTLAVIRRHREARAEVHVAPRLATAAVEVGR